MKRIGLTGLGVATVAALAWNAPAMAGDMVEDKLEALQERIKYLEDRVASQDQMIVEKEGEMAGLSDGWFNNVSVGGVIELELVSESPAGEDSTTSAGVATAELGIAAAINDEWGAEVLLEEDDGIKLADAFVTYEPASAGLSAAMGLQTLPFGVYETNLVSDPLTKGIGETAHTSLVLGGEAAQFGWTLFTYLQTVTDLLIDDLEWMTAQWAPGGEARAGLVGGDVNQGLATIFTGMGSLSYGELAGERMQLGLLLHDPEEEHDCFSDNTHASHYYDALGIQNIYLGTYERVDGSVVQGPSVSDLVAAASSDADAALRERLDATMMAMGEVVSAAEGGEAYDQQIGEGNPAGNARVQAAIDALTAQTSAIEGAVAALNLAAIDFEGSDSLDDPEAVFE